MGPRNQREGYAVTILTIIGIAIAVAEAARIGFYLCVAICISAIAKALEPRIRGGE